MCEKEEMIESIGLDSFQPHTRLSESPYLKGVNKAMTEQDTTCLPLASTYGCVL